MPHSLVKNEWPINSLMDMSPVPYCLRGYESNSSYVTTPDQSPCSPFLMPAFIPVFSFSAYSAYMMQPQFVQTLCPPQPCYPPQSPNKLQLPPSSPTEAPVYVNAQQYNRILKRRMTRGSSTPRLREHQRTYRHESRHQHACRRLRGPKGKFLSKAETQQLLQQDSHEGCSEEERTPVISLPFD